MSISGRIDELIRSAIALQVAVIEFDNSDITDCKLALDAIDAAVARIVKGVKQLKKEI